MIPVTISPEPATFCQRCRQRGQAWLATHPNPTEGVTNYWREFIPDLCRAFSFRCAYLAMLDVNGTVDHFLSTNRNRHLAYEWTNYRYATGWLNSSKKTLDDRVLDPLAVREEWFEVDLASLHLCLTPAVPARIRPIAEFTLERLGLKYGPRTMQSRQHYYTEFRSGAFPLDYLEQIAPLIAVAVRRQRLLDHLTVNTEVARCDVGGVCGTTQVRGEELATIWRLSGHIAAVGRGPHVRYRIA